MVSRKWKFSLPLAILVFFLFSSSAFCDITWESEKVLRGVPGQPDGTRVQKNYYTSNASRIEMGDGTVMIMDFDSMNMFRLNTRDKTYTQVNLSETGSPGQMPREERQKMDKMMGEMMQSFQVTPTNDTKTIAGYPCRKYLISFMQVRSEYWLSKDVRGYDELKSIGDRMSKYYAKNPMLKQMDVAGMMDKLDGFPVMTVTQMMKGTVTTTLRKVEVGSLSPDLFQVPADYTLKQEQDQSQTPQGPQRPSAPTRPQPPQ